MRTERSGASQVATFAHELSEPRPRRGTIAATRNGTGAPAPTTRPATARRQNTNNTHRRGAARSQFIASRCLFQLLHVAYTATIVSCLFCYISQKTC